MQLLVNIPALTGQPNDNGSDLLKEDFDTMLEGIVRNIDRDAKIQTTNIILGAKDPDYIVKTAKSWNETIQKALMKAMESMLAKAGRIKLDSSDTYSLANIAITADGTFHPNSLYGLIHAASDSRTAMTGTVMTDDILKDITACPETYALLTTYISIQDETA